MYHISSHIFKKISDPTIDAHGRPKIPDVEFAFIDTGMKTSWLLSNTVVTCDSMSCTYGNGRNVNSRNSCITLTCMTSTQEACFLLRFSSGNITWF
jgi:hypothetical protein